MKKIFFLFVVAGIGVLTVVKAQSLDGTPCVGEWAKKRVCDSPARVVEFECVSANCHWRADKDRCDDEQTKCESACRQENDTCACKPDPNLGTHLQYTYVDKVYTSCKDACGAKSVRCFSACSTAWAACDKAAADASAACRKKLSWEKSGEFPCEEGMKCTERESGAACLYPPSGPAAKDSVGSLGGDMAKYLDCLSEADAKYENKDGQICLPACKQFYWYGCVYDPGRGTELQKCILENLPDLKAAHDECERKYGSGSAPEAVPPAAEEPAPEGALPVAPGFSDESDLSLSRQELDTARAFLEKIKQKNDQRWADKKNFAIDYDAELERVLEESAREPGSREQEEKKLRALRATFQDIHKIASKGRGWEKFPDTLESIRKGKVGSYSKLNFYTNTVYSFNEYNDLRERGVSVENASAKAILDNYGASALTVIPVLKAIDLVATTPDMVLNIFGVDKDNWSRKYVTAGVIGKFSPTGVVKQTTDLMIENKWSDIGNALSYQWGKVKSADGVVDTAAEAGKLVVGAVGAVPVAFASAMRDTTAATISVFQHSFGAGFDWLMMRTYR